MLNTGTFRRLRSSINVLIEKHNRPDKINLFGDYVPGLSIPVLPRSEWRGDAPVILPPHQRNEIIGRSLIEKPISPENTGVKNWEAWKPDPGSFIPPPDPVPLIGQINVGPARGSGIRKESGGIRHRNAPFRWWGGIAIRPSDPLFNFCRTRPKIRDPELSSAPRILWRWSGGLL